MVRALLIIVLVLAVLVLIGFVMGYNKIRAADIRAAEALSGIDVELTRRAALIPSLVHTVQTFAAHEKDVFDHVTDARAALTSAMSGKSVAQRSTAEKELDSALTPLLALGESYPQLTSSNNFLQPAGQPRRHREQAGVRPAVLQRRGRHAEPAHQHHPVDVRRTAEPCVRARVLPGAPVDMRIVFAGTPEPALPSLRRLIDSARHDVVAVLTRPDAASGRRGKASPSPVAQLALERDIPVLRPPRPNSDEFVAELSDLAPDACAVVAYGALLRDGLLAVPRHGWINLHFSLLPAWRGAAPVQAAIAAGDAVTGATTFQIEAALDSGPVYGVVTETVRPTDTAGDLLDRLSISGAALLETTLDGIADGTLTAGATTIRRRHGRAEGHGRRCPGALGPARPRCRAADQGRHPEPGGVDRRRGATDQAGAGDGRRRGTEPPAPRRNSSGSKRRARRDSIAAGAAGQRAAAGQEADGRRSLGARCPTRRVRKGQMRAQ